METKQTAVEWLVEQMIYQMDIRIENTTIGCELFEQAKKMEKGQMGYTKEDVLKAGEIGEINHHDYKHIVKLLDEARELNRNKK